MNDFATFGYMDDDELLCFLINTFAAVVVEKHIGFMGGR
jgi:hypothetical protein